MHLVKFSQLEKDSVHEGKNISLRFMIFKCRFVPEHVCTHWVKMLSYNFWHSECNLFSFFSFFFYENHSAPETKDTSQYLYLLVCL